MMDRGYLNECFTYDPNSGLLLWRRRPQGHFKTARGCYTFNAQRAGKSAGCASKTADGLTYLKVRLDGRLYLAHRLIWTMWHDAIPTGMEVDHKDHDGTNNRLSNLRLVSSSGNKKNRRIGRRNTSGSMGVYWSEPLGKWYAQIWSDGTHHYLGTFCDFDEAVSARKRAESHLGFHRNHGNGHFAKSA